MKKLLLILIVVFGLFLITSAQSMAAPSVSFKYGAGVGIAGLELGFPIHDSWSIIAQGGFADCVIRGGAGVRYYFGAGSYRLFATAYVWGDFNFDFDHNYTGYEIFIKATGGLEYLGPNGLRADMELILFTPRPDISVSIGYQF